jgi:lysozyme
MNWFVGLLLGMVPFFSVNAVAMETDMEKLIETLKRHEGVKTHAYRDSLGVLTIGCGRNISDNERHHGLGLSDDEIDYMLSNDILRTIKELAEEYPWFNDMAEGARRDAIINMHFNLGRVRFASFKIALSYMDKADHKRAAGEFLNSKWAKQVKGRALEVTDMIATNTYV